MSKKLSWNFLLLCTMHFALFTSLAYPEEAELKLNSSDGSSAFIVQDVASQTVFKADSDGNVLVKGTMTVQGNSLSVGGSSLFVSTSGNVGIGTTVPIAKLEVNGEIAMYDNNQGIIRRANYNGSYGLAFVSTDQEPTLNGNGWYEPNDTTNYGGAITIEGGKPSDGWDGGINIMAYGSGTAGNSNAISFYRRTGVDTYGQSMRIDKNGNIGIGTTSPGYKLDLYATSAGVPSAEIIGVKHNLNLSNSYVGTEYNRIGLKSLVDGSMDYTGSPIGVFGEVSVTGKHNAGARGVYGYAHSGGEGSIGVDGYAAATGGFGGSYSFPWHYMFIGVRGQTSGTGTLAYSAADSQGNFGGYFKAATGRTNVGIYASASGGTANYAAIFDSGNVGIGTASPTATLEVAVGGTTLADAWTVRSSEKYKTNIRTLKGALEKVEQLRGVSYDRKFDGKHEIGIIAEEVAEVLPEIVAFEKDGKEAQGVDYARLSALLIEAVKEQQNEIASQRLAMTELQRQVKDLQLQIGKGQK